MLEKILEYERALFLKLNGAHSMFGDQFMWLFSGFSVWIPVAVCFLVILLYTNRKRWKETLLIVAAIVLVIVFTDQFSSGLCKPFFARFRPTHHPDFMNDVCTVFNYRGGPYGFISSHAANGFGFATLTSLIFKNRYYTILLLSWAIVSAYSRIYLGVHFISDIIPGMITGIFFGWAVYQMFVYAHKKLSLYHAVSLHETPYPNQGLSLFLTFMIVTVVLIVIAGILYACQIIPALQIK